jgi:protein TonB
MFTTLLESRAPRTRRAGGTVASVLVHGSLIAGAVALTWTRPVVATPAPPTPRDSLIFIIPREPVPHAPTTARPGPPLPPNHTFRPPTIEFNGVVPTDIPPVDLGATVIPPEDVIIGRGGRIGEPAGGLTSGTGVGAPGGVIGERDVDRAPRVLGDPPRPRYPDALRAAGITGRVVVQFVVDTLGRAEPGMEVVDGGRQEFVDAVRAALPRFRFTVGEMAGRRVRTRVQVPFDFSLR